MKNVLICIILGAFLFSLSSCIGITARALEGTSEENIFAGTKCVFEAYDNVFDKKNQDRFWGNVFEFTIATISLPFEICLDIILLPFDLISISEQQRDRGAYGDVNDDVLEG